MTFSILVLKSSFFWYTIYFYVKMKYRKKKRKFRSQKNFHPFHRPVLFCFVLFLATTVSPVRQNDLNEFATIGQKRLENNFKSCSTSG